MKRLLLSFTTLAFLCACTTTSIEQIDTPPLAMNSPLERKTINLVGPESKAISVVVEIADEPVEQQRGLMGRTELPPFTGMLFIFDQPVPLSFWMKNTLIPLDILYFDAEGKLVSSTTMTPCTADPCQTYPSKGNAKFALEMEAGFIQGNGVTTEWRLIAP